MIIDELFESPQQCPECGGISFSDLILAEKKDACYHKVKASAKVWPSAYASGRLVQCRKKGAANYGNKSEGVAEGSLGKVLSFPDLLGQVKHILDAKHRSIGWKMSKRDDDVFLFSAMNDYDVRSMLVVAKDKDGWVSATNGIVDPYGEVEMFDKQELPMTLASASEIADEAISTYHDIDLSDYADEDKQGMAEGVMYGAENLDVGDDVIISGDVELNGATGVIDSFGQDKRFVVVDLYNHGRHSFHSSDVSANDYDRDEHDDMLDEKSVSQAQFRTMAAAAHNPKFARKVGISQDVAQEFNQADKKSNYKKLPARATEGEQQPGADYRDPKEVDYDGEYDAMVARVKKLAGLGPMKTVYDPTKRQYRNMPTAQQPKK